MFGQAISQMAKYLAEISRLSDVKARTEDELLDIKLTGKADEDVERNIHARIAKLETQISLCKQFLEFWKEVLKSGIQILASFNELVSSGR